MFDGKQVGSRSVDGVVSLSLFLKRSTLMGSMFFMFNSKGFLSKCYLFFFLIHYSILIRFYVSSIDYGIETR